VIAETLAVVKGGVGFNDQRGMNDGIFSYLIVRNQTCTVQRRQEEMCKERPFKIINEDIGDAPRRSAL
jgi:hypothetical protein